ncbi:unnamed protein product [Polarella glacialis]|uniref:SET domain-containing protein n=1 Tax=Polarella glacialis TaxID=89957 RepID=A0A813KAD9_POLGL|nr:unnamed protein product [Polarella glacialis]
MLSSTSVANAFLTPCSRSSSEASRPLAEFPGPVAAAASGTEGVRGSWATAAGVLVGTALGLGRRGQRQRQHQSACSTCGLQAVSGAQAVGAEDLLRAGFYDAALSAIGSEEDASPRSRALRAAALVGLRRYSEGKHILEGLDAKAARIDLGEFHSTLERLQRQWEKGDFQFWEVFGPALEAREAGKDPAEPASETSALLPQVPDFVGPVEVGATGRGRGLFLRELVRAGEVLLCAPPLVRALANSAQLEDSLVAALREAVRLSPHVLRVTTNMLADGKGGQEKAVRLADFAWQEPSIEAAQQELPSGEQLEGVVQTNGFAGFGYCMLYGAVSMLNHSCCPNASSMAVGRSLIVRANQAIGEGQEACISYFDVLKPVKEREREAATWSFRCECPRCEFERRLPEDLQDNGLSVSEVEAAIQDPANGLDPAGREVQWLRASHVEAYKAELEAAFPMGEVAVAKRQQLLRCLEATDPASFTHAKIAYIDWLAKQAKPGPKDPVTQQAMRYADLVHQARYGKVPGEHLVTLLKQTQRAAESTLVGEEFCNPAARTLVPADRLPTATPAVASPPPNAGGTAMSFLD